MSDKDVPPAVVFILILFTACLTWALTTEAWKKEAVRHGAARVYLDENTNVQWEWINK